MIRPGTNGFERLSNFAVKTMRKVFKSAETHLFAISINLIHINSIEIKVSSILGTGFVPNQDL